MNIFNCHTHTKHSSDCSAEPDKMTLAAISAGLFGYAVTDHIDTELAGFPYSGEDPEGSFEDAVLQREKHPELIILAGVEMGQAILNPAYEKHILELCRWDIVMGSVHSVRMKGFTDFFSGIDFTGFDDKFIDSYLTQYFIDLEETAETTDYDSLSHLTVPLRYIVHKYKRNVIAERYFESIRRILKTVIKRGKSLELNTSGFTESERYFMPDEYIIDEYIKLGGKDFTLGSDAHIPENMTSGLIEGTELLLSKGIKTLNYYKDRKKITYDTEGVIK